MLIVIVWRFPHRPEPVEDLVSTDIGRVVQVSEPDLVARRVGVDLLQMTKRIGPQCEAAEHKDLSGRKVSPWTMLLLTIEGAIKPLQRQYRGTLNESTNVGVKTGGSRVGVPICASKANGNRRQGTQCLPRFRPSRWR